MNLVTAPGEKCITCGCESWGSNKYMYQCNLCQEVTCPDAECWVSHTGRCPVKCESCKSTPFPCTMQCYDCNSFMCITAECTQSHSLRCKDMYVQNHLDYSGITNLFEIEH